MSENKQYRLILFSDLAVHVAHLILTINAGVLRIAHLRIAPLEGNLEVGKREGIITSMTIPPMAIPTSTVLNCPQASLKTTQIMIDGWQSSCDIQRDEATMKCS